ncbi:hypothetical protein GGR56DRAFT_664933 [Xylariaceae sp. FL0804]|nr:hypothetical protein GGR56DRAFT_664933 [Xylariaceae sp. FL0804]
MQFSIALALSAFILSCVSGGIVPSSNGSLGLRESYDYIIVGAGIGGLVVANRLSENPSVSVLVIEAGVLDDGGEDITVPGTIGIESPSRYEWTMSTTPQVFLDNNTRTLPQGRVVGGSTVTNGLCWTRGSRADYDAWERLGNPGWGWDGLLPYFLKTENYAAPGPETLQGWTHIPPGPITSSYGSGGPVDVGYPNYVYNQSYNFLDGMQELGIPLNEDINNGDPTGTNFIPSSMTSRNQSRSDARTAYLDSALHRPNLNLLTGQTVTRLLHTQSNSTMRRSSTADSSITVTGVELTIHRTQFAANSTAPRHNISCDGEVIIAAGAVMSPVLLQVSGIGPAALLRSLGIDVAVDLPGVGSNLQDHPMVQPVYNYTAPDVFTAWDIVGSTRDAVRAEYLANRTGPWTAPMVNAVAFPALAWVAPDPEALLAAVAGAADADANVTDPLGLLPPSYDATLRAGYAAQRRELAALLARNDTAGYEVMSASWGQLGVSVMHPFSRGTVTALSASVFGDDDDDDGGGGGGDPRRPAVAVDPRYCSHPLDCDLLRAALAFNDALIATPAMAALQPVAPPGFGGLGGSSNNSSNNSTGNNSNGNNATALNEALRRSVGTEFHLSGTTAMLPLALGGAVDPALCVYGTRALRVVDAAVLPLLPGAHIQAVVYAVAERAADIIKGTVAAPASSSSYYEIKPAIDAQASTHHPNYFFAKYGDTVA